MQILFASSNPHKLEEVAAVLTPLGIEVIGLDAVPDRGGPEPVEDADTFAGNARIKAVTFARRTNRMCLADDSGLEVDALGGVPGVYSARYGGEGSTRDERDEANNRKLLRELDGVPPEKRTARFVCAMCLADEDALVVAETRGTMPGLIADAPRGENGFGYDPLLYLPDAGCTSAELTPQEKNARSHRGVAARDMALKLRELISS